MDIYNLSPSDTTTYSDTYTPNTTNDMVDTNTTCMDTLPGIEDIGVQGVIMVRNTSSIGF